MEQQPTPSSPQQPVQPVNTPAPAQSNGGWGVFLGAAIALILIAGGVYYFFIEGNNPIQPYQETTPNTTGTTESGQDQNVDSIEADLNASGNAETSGELSNLEQSL